MTVDSTPTSVVYVVNETLPGVEYPITFPYMKTTDIRAYISEGTVEKTPLPNGSAFSVVDQTLTTLIVLPLNATLVIYRETELTQDILWVDGQAVYPPSIMKGDDKLTYIVQELANQVDRSIKVEREDAESGMDAEKLLQEIFETARRAKESAAQADRYWQLLTALIPIPTVDDIHKLISVVVVGNEAKYALVRTGGGGGGGEGTGWVDYAVPVPDASGRVVINLDELGHPSELGLFNPIINLLSADPYYYTIVGRSDKEFIVQIFRPDGTPEVDIVLHVEIGTFELGDGTELGMSGTGATVTLLVSLPI